MGFVDTGINWNTWVTIQDRSSSPLFGGSKIYLFCDNESFGGNINKGVSTKIMPTVPNYVGSNVGSVWQNMIGQQSFTGINNHKITLQARWSVGLGSYGTAGVSEPILTPYKTIILATSGRQFYLNDERIINQIALESGSQFYGKYGIPITIDDYSFVAISSKDQNIVGINLTITEDKI